MTTSAPAPPALPSGLHLFDRRDDADRDGKQLALRLDHARVWADARDLAILGEHIRSGSAAELMAAITGCVRDRAALLVWDAAACFADNEVLGWCVLQLRGLPLIEGHQDQRWIDDHGLLVPVPTGYPIKRWKPEDTPATAGGR
jgi:hypothetical protein